MMKPNPLNWGGGGGWVVYLLIKFFGGAFNREGRLFERGVYLIIWHFRGVFNQEERLFEWGVYSKKSGVWLYVKSSRFSPTYPRV